MVMENRIKTWIYFNVKSFEIHESIECIFMNFLKILNMHRCSFFHQNKLILYKDSIFHKSFKVLLFMYVFFDIDTYMGTQNSDI